MNIYITSINNGSGKTLIAGGIAAVMQSLGYNTGVYKPIQTGAISKEKFLISPDLTFIKMLDPYITAHSTYMMKTKAMPIIASETEKVNIKKEDIIRDYSILAEKTDTLLVEATGGLMTPLKDDFFNYNIPLKLQLPVIFVLNPFTDDINHYLNELNTAKTAGLDIVGVIINKFSVYSDNPEIKLFPQLIEKYSDAKVLGLIRNFKGSSIKANILIDEILNGIDFEDVFRMKIPKLNKD